ncbi:MAG TPA: DUF1223 domain-containing protein [Alphaproteobacteria bacterium]|nr:DUF1223 domain-containing protein [Alphaproteobacteria bacterium]
MKRRTTLFVLGATVIGLAGSSLAATSKPPVVVELFTSQGCSSCPPADAYLGELAQRPGIVALAFHVDYWDYIGWKDPFASPASTARQQRYKEALGNRFLYTPEMVIDGRADATGSDRASVSKLLRAEEARGGKIPVTVVETAEDKYQIEIPAAPFPGEATVWMALFDKEHTTAVAAGENDGRHLREFNVVREFRPLGRWRGKALQIPVDMTLTPANGCAVLLQADARPGDGQGPILGAALFTEK